MWVYIPYDSNKYERRYYPEGQSLETVCAMNTGWVSEPPADALVTDNNGVVLQAGAVTPVPAVPAVPDVPAETKRGQSKPRKEVS